jgi:hypothetical protein
MYASLADFFHRSPAAVRRCRRSLAAFFTPILIRHRCPSSSQTAPQRSRSGEPCPAPIHSTNAGGSRPSELAAGLGTVSTAWRLERSFVLRPPLSENVRVIEMTYPYTSLWKSTGDLSRDTASGVISRIGGRSACMGYSYPQTCPQHRPFRQSDAE